MDRDLIFEAFESALSSGFTQIAIAEQCDISESSMRQFRLKQSLGRDKLKRLEEWLVTKGFLKPDARAARSTEDESNDIDLRNSPTSARLLQIKAARLALDQRKAERIELFDSIVNGEPEAFVNLVSSQIKSAIEIIEAPSISASTKHNSLQGLKDFLEHVAVPISYALTIDPAKQEELERHRKNFSEGYTYFNF